MSRFKLFFSASNDGVGVVLSLFTNTQSLAIVQHPDASYHSRITPRTVIPERGYRESTLTLTFLAEATNPKVKMDSR